MTTPKVDAGELLMLSTSELLLDWHNPRLRPDEQLSEDQEPDSEEHQRVLALLMNREYNPLPIAESIARHQYFLSEPMIAVRHNDRYRVIEGNRRLTALRGLQDASLRQAFSAENRGWRGIPEGDYEGTFPVLVVRNEATIAPLLGYRHISGIEPWAAYAQARYIVGLVQRNHSLEEIAELVGKKPTVVRSMYRDHDILEQASNRFGIDTSRARNKFGVFNNAMGRQGVRSFIGAPAPREVDPERWPVPDNRRDELQELLVYIFGEPHGRGAAISDSRQLGVLSKVLAEPSGRGLAVLRKGGDLDQAEAAIEEPDEQFGVAVASALRNLMSAPTVDPGSLDRDTISQLDLIQTFVSAYLNGANLQGEQ